MESLEIISHVSCFVNKLPINNANSFIILQSQWSDNELIINLLNGNDGYTGVLKFEELSKFALSWEIQFDEFLKQTKSILCTENGLPDFLYEIDENKFYWKKNQTIKVIYGIINLTEKSNLKEIMFMDSLKLISQLREELTNQTKKFNEFQQLHDEYVESYKKCVDEKVGNESLMLTKFLALLNSKKDKINELTQLLDKTDKTLLPETIQSKTKFTHRLSSSESEIEKNEPKLKNLELIDSEDSEDETQIFTYNIPKRQATEVTKKLKSEPEPSTSKAVIPKESTPEEEIFEANTQLFEFD